MENEITPTEMENEDITYKETENGIENKTDKEEKPEKIFEVEKKEETKKNKKIFYFAIIIILVLGGIIGLFIYYNYLNIYGEIKSVTIVDNGGYPSFKVSISGNTDLEVVLIKNKNEIDSQFISERQLQDGEETVYLRMGGWHETPIGGTYKILLYHDSRELYSWEKIYLGPALVITNFDPEFEEYYYLEEAYMTHIEITYRNIGDLPAYVAEIYLSSALDQQYKSVSEDSQYIAPGEEVTLTGSTFLEVPYIFGVASIDVTVALLDSEREVLASL